MKGEVEVLDERGRALDRDDWPMVRVRRTRAPQLDCRIGFRRDGWERYFRANFVPVPYGHAAWPAGSVVSSWEEITAEREAQRTAVRLESEAAARRATEDVLRSMTAIANATDALARVDVQHPDLNAVAAALAPDFADVMRLVLVDAAGVTADAVAAGPEVGAAAVAREQAWPVASVFHPMRIALESGRTQFVANVASRDWPRWYPDVGDAPVIDADAPASLIAVPVRRAGAVCGVLLAIRTLRGNRPFTERDVAVAEGFASTLGIFTDRLAVWQALEAELQERRQVQEQLKASEETFRVAATTITELVFSVHIATGHCHFGTAGLQLIGDAVDADYRTMISRWLRRVHADDRARVVAHIRSLASESVDEATVEYRMRDMADAERWVYQRIVVVRDGLGFPVRLVGALRDETEERVTRNRLAADRARLAEIVEEQTRELSQANADLSRSARLKDEFLASMSHELRTPVNAVLGIGEALADGVFGPVIDRQREALRDLVDSGQHLLGLINDILDLSKIAAGRMEPIVEPMNVAEACDAAVRVVQQQAFEKGLKLRSDLPPGGRSLNTDQRWLRQILVNLLGNAVKFTPPGGAIVLEVVEEPTAIAFTVRDTGIGIATGDMDRLFQPFVQLDQGLNRRQGGTGLGLALVRRFVDLLGGTVGVVSEIGKGSAFTVRLPRPEPSADIRDDAVPQPLAVPDSAPMPAGTRGHVLLAEDNAANVRTFVGYLEAKGFHVEVANNGVEAVEIALRTKPGVILMDVQMPEKDGLQAMREIAAAMGDSAPPMLALTAFAMPGDRERCLDAGAVAHLPKPVNLKELVTTVDHWLRRGKRPA